MATSRLGSSLGLHTGRSVLDITSTSIAPQGLGPLGPFYQLLYAFSKRYFNIDISSIVKKAISVGGAILMMRLVWSLAKETLATYFTCSIKIPVEHKVGKGVERWLVSKAGNSVKRHTSYHADTIGYNELTQAPEIFGEKRTATGSGWFLFEGRPLYFSVFTYPIGKSVKATYEYDPDIGSISRSGGPTLSGSKIRVYSLFNSSGIVLEHFTTHVANEEFREAAYTSVFAPNPPNEHEGSWHQHTKPIRPISTIDLDEDLKVDLINDIDRFFSVFWERWYGQRGIPHKRGIC